jgi:hypothetical protein
MTAVYVTGTSTLTGCVKTYTQQISVSVSPQLFISTSNASSCVGKTVTLTAVGAGMSYNWSNGSNNASIVVSPTTTTTYSVFGVNGTGCSTMAAQQVTVNTPPSLVVAASANQVCSGDMVTLTALGASSYQWTSGPSAIMFGSPLVTSLTSSKVFTVTGTDTKGCSGTAMITVEVNECTGISEVNGNGDIKVYPNPATSTLKVELNGSSYKTVQLLDMTGRVILSQSVDAQNSVLNISKYANGVYFVKAVSDNSVKVIRVVKQD